MKSLSYGLILAAIGPAALCSAEAPRHGDLLVGLTSGNTSAIYVVNPLDGHVRGLLSGSPGWPTPPRGLGPSLGQSWCSVICTRDGRIFAGGTNSGSSALLRIDPVTGNRTALASVWQSPYREAATVVLRDQQTAIVSGQFTSTSRIGTFHSIALSTGAVSSLAGGVLSDGPAMSFPISFSLLSRNLLVSADFVSSPVNGLATFETDLQQSTQRFLTLPASSAITRFTVASGVASSAPTSFAPFGTGEFSDQSSHPIGTAAGEVYFSAISQHQGGFIGGVVRVDRTNGNRELVLGDALDASNQIVSVAPSSGLASYHALPSAFFESPTGELLIGEWDPDSRVVAFNADTRSTRIVADFAAYFAPASSLLRVRGIAIYTNCPADINLDGVADDADFGRFVGAYDILDCADAAMPVPCPADLNADGVVDDSDFAIFVVGYDKLVCE